MKAAGEAASWSPAQLPAELRAHGQTGVLLKNHCWFRTGGPVSFWYEAPSLEALAQFLQNCPWPLLVLGAGSNVLLRDGGFEGVLVTLGSGFRHITHGSSPESPSFAPSPLPAPPGRDGDVYLWAGAGVRLMVLARYALDHGIAGLNFLAGIPGTVGGALRMNAGTALGEMKDIVTRATFLDRSGQLHTRSVEAMGFSYRHSSWSSDWVAVAAEFRFRPGDETLLRREFSDLQKKRRATQPGTQRTGGSSFKNPPFEKAWRLIDQAGLRGARVGGARVSPLHCNFLINTGSASSCDLESLGNLIRKRVYEQTGTLLVWEIHRLGQFAAGQLAGAPGEDHGKPDRESTP